MTVFSKIKGRRWEVCWALRFWEAWITFCTYKTCVTQFQNSVPSSTAAIFKFTS